MKVGLIGFAGSGKSTLYRAASRGQAKGSVTAVPVPDDRFEAIVAQVRPKKVTPASVILHDDLDSAQGSGSRMFSQKFIDEARKMDLLLHVVRGFDSPSSPYHAEVDPLRDQSRIDEELLLVDLQMVETRLEKLAKSIPARNPGSPEYLEKALFERVRPTLEEGRPARSLEFGEDEQTLMRNYSFLTAKPMVCAFNVGEADAVSPGEKLTARIRALCKSGVPSFAVCATIEEEIAQLDPCDQPEFLASLGLEAPAANRVIQAVYDALGLITFFTAGENETRAWPLRRGSTALKAAATIHTDIARGFIRAEIVSYEDYRAAGSLQAAYAANKMRLEGKDYIVNDGDLIHIRNKS